MSTQPYGNYPSNDSGGVPNSNPVGPGGVDAAPGGTGVAGVVGPPRRVRRPLASLAVVAVLAAGVGGGGALAYDHTFEHPQTTQTAGTTSSTSTSGGASTTGGSSGTSGSTVSQVVGGTGSTNWTQVASTVSRSVVSIIVTGSSESDEGTGVVIDNAGHIVTNNHVVSSVSGTIQVQVGNTLYKASVVGTDPSTDLAVLKVANLPASLRPISFANSSQVKVGDPVMAVGNPLGLSDTVTTGIVSALNRPVVTQEVTTSASNLNSSTSGGYGSGGSSDSNGSDAGNVYTSAIQTSAPINPGNSGGALVNAAGQLVGINSSIASLASDTSSSDSQSGSIGIGFAIPSNQVKQVADELIAKGTAQLAFLGVSSTDGSVTSGSVTTDGAKVTGVANGTPAAAAGVKTGDVIVAVDGVQVDSSDALVAQIHTDQPGQKVTLTIIRNGHTQTLTATLGTAPTTTSQTQTQSQSQTQGGTGSQTSPYGTSPYGSQADPFGGSQTNPFGTGQTQSGQ